MIRILLLIANATTVLFVIGSMLAHDTFRNDPKRLRIGLIITAVTLANATYIWLVPREPRPRSQRPRLSLREISTALACEGFTAPRGLPYSASAVVSMLT
jgi:hypothetical protein